MDPGALRARPQVGQRRVDGRLGLGLAEPARADAERRQRRPRRRQRLLGRGGAGAGGRRDDDGRERQSRVVEGRARADEARVPVGELPQRPVAPLRVRDEARLAELDELAAVVARLGDGRRARLGGAGRGPREQRAEPRRVEHEARDHALEQRRRVLGQRQRPWPLPLSDDRAERRDALRERRARVELQRPVVAARRRGRVGRVVRRQRPGQPEAPADLGHPEPLVAARSRALAVHERHIRRALALARPELAMVRGGVVRRLPMVRRAGLAASDEHEFAVLLALAAGGPLFALLLRDIRGEDDGDAEEGEQGR